MSMEALRLQKIVEEYNKLMIGKTQKEVISSLFRRVCGLHFEMEEICQEYFDVK